MDDKLFDIFSKETDVPECVLRRVDETLEMIENSADADKSYEAIDRTGRKIKKAEKTTITLNTVGKRRSSQKKNWKRSLILSFEAVMVFGVAVFAAEKYMGISSFWDEMGNKMPEEAEVLIEKEPVQQEDGESILSYTVKEALCDKNSIQIVVEAAAKEKGKYFVIGQDMMDEDSVRNIGIESDKTVAEYAAEKGLTIVRAGVSFDFGSELGIRSAMGNYRHQEDDVLDFYSSAVKENQSKDLTVSCIGTATLPDAKSVDDVMRTNITFKLEDKSQGRSVTYVPEATADTENGNEQDGIITADGKVKILSVDIDESETTEYVSIHYIMLEKSESISLDVTDKDGNLWQISDLGGFAPITEVGEEGIWQFAYQKTDLPDKIGVRVYDYENDVKYEPVMMVMQK
ncbi:hypothetical protein ACTQWG_01645 [Blautia sp. HCP3S3_H10_1]|uniref:hypothetical protein n=1 Tax=unclassified Blautia TaxID=2648079 RepID=UPI003F8F6757